MKTVTEYIYGRGEKEYLIDNIRPTAIVTNSFVASAEKQKEFFLNETKPLYSRYDEKLKFIPIDYRV